MPAHEAVALRTIHGFLIVPVPGFKLGKRLAKWAAVWLPMLAITLLPPVASAGFVTTRSYPAGTAPVSVAVGDFNGDGIPDLAVLDLPTEAGLYHALSVLLGRGDGSFGPPRQYAVGSNAQALALGDLNGDGRLDIVVSNTADGNLSLFLGKGDGTFQVTRAYTLGGPPAGVVVGDFDQDGIPDLAVAMDNTASSDKGTLSILLGNGDGTFRAPQSYDVGNYPWSVVAADFNGDGILDLAVTNSNLQQPAQESTVSILLGNGDGTFQAAVNYPVGADPRSLVAADFNGDGNVDLAVSNNYSMTLSVLLGNGDGSFQAALNYPSAPRADDSTGYYYTLAVADFNGDGHLDLAVTGQYGVVLWLGQGDGTFQTGASYNVGMGSVAVADFNQDGHADLAVTNAEANAVRILLGRGDGTFQAAPSYASGSANASTVAAGDFNGDGIPDLAVGNIGFLPTFPTGAVAIFLGNGDGTFQNVRSLSTDAGPVGLAAADLNGDAKQDLLVTVWDPGFARFNLPKISGLRVWLGNGDGSFAKGASYDTQAGFYAAAVGDLNGDGIPDVAAPNYGWPFQGGNTVTVFLGKGDGTLGGKHPYPVPVMPSAVALADFNGDGYLDMAVAASGGLSILLGNGDGTFRAAQNYAQVPGASLTVADFNGDGHLDIAVWMVGVPGSAGTVQILLGQGDGTFQPGPSFPAGSAGLYTSAGLVSGDFNGDGIPDLAVTDSAAGSVSVLLGKGDGTFAPPQRFPVGSPVNALLVADFNGDGNLDLAVASGSTATILLNDGQWAP